jgi:hypothetical protein
MRHRGLSAFIVVTLKLNFLNFLSISPASAAFVGSNQCVQTVDTSSGVTVHQDLGFCYVAFRLAGSYTWTPPATLREIDLLVVAGGGGGGSRHAGGGGAGGVINLNSVAINGTDISLVVGEGGNGGAAAGSGGNNGINGDNSQISGGGLTTRIAIGGGGGGYGGTTNSGGSGAGGGSSSVGGANTVGQGNPGSAGATNSSSYWVGGGGGGAGETGTTSSSSKAGSGGGGVAISWLTANAATATGVGILSSSQYFVGGGGGGGSDRNGIAGGSAGIGGGGRGSTGTATPEKGTTNSGGGGGGSGISGVGTGSLKGGDGGRGVVLIRYLIPVAQFDASNYTAASTTWANSISGGTSGTTSTGGMTKTSSGPSGVVFAGKESSNSDQLSSSIGTTSALDAVTVEMWLKLKDSGSTQNAAGSMLFSWGPTSYNIYHYGNQVGFNTFASQLYGIDSTSYNNSWTHFVFAMTDTGDWSSQKIYVNGALQVSTCRVTPSACTSSQSRAFQSSGNYLLMDNGNAVNTWNAKGDMGQFKIFNRELSAAQVSANYNSSSSSYIEADSTPPGFTNGTTFSVAENTSASTTVATISVNESATISIVSGVDSALFISTTVDSVTAQIRFSSSPDFESPQDVGSNNVYNITIRAVDTLGNSGDQAISITVTNVNESSTIGAPSFSGAASKGSVITITVTTNAAGKVRFFVSGKRISNCLARSTTGSSPSFTATCSWKPPVTGRQSLTARITPTNSSFTTATSETTSIWVVRRSNSR